MSSTFAGIEIGRRALSASQTIIETTGHNIANVNTPGYSRQRAELTASDPWSMPSEQPLASPQQLGTGVQITAVQRLHDDYLEQRIQGANGSREQLNQLQDALNRVQAVYQEPGGGGVSSDLTAFFNSFQDLSHNPENSSLRIVVRDKATTLATHIKDLNTGLAQVRSDVLGKLTQTVDQANAVAKNVAELNKQIQLALAAGQQPNDLQDKRDALIQQLSTLVGASATIELDAQGKPTGALNVSVNGYAIVQDGQAIALPSTTGTYNGKLTLSDGVNTILLQSGAAAGLAQSVDLIAGYKSDLDTVASSLITQVNAVHSAGYGLDGVTGRAFFAGTDASTIGLDRAIAASTDAIAAAAPPAAGQPVAPGNGDMARAIADLASAPLVGTKTLGDFYASGVTRIGSDAQGFKTSSDTQTQVVQQLQNLRNSVSGVNLDEELSNMLQYQRSYQAAARFMSTVDEMIGTIVTGLGSTIS